VFADVSEESGVSNFTVKRAELGDSPLATWFLLDFLFDPEYEGDIFL
jgi:hypothetical protein